MTVTPQDIQNKEFREAFRGYNQDDVDTFLDAVAEEHGRLSQENQRLRIQLASLQQEAAHRPAQAAAPAPAAVPGAPTPAAPPSLRAEERAGAREEMKRALVATQRAAEAALEEAKRRAAEIVARAEQRAKEIDELTARRAKDVDSDASSALTYAQQRVEELRRQEQELRGRLRRMLSEHVKMLQQLEGESVAANAGSVPDSPASAPIVLPSSDDPGAAGSEQPRAAAAEPAASMKAGAAGRNGGARATRWDAPRSKSPAEPAPRAEAPARSAGLAPTAPVRSGGSSEAAGRAAVVARMAKELGEAAEPRPRNGGEAPSPGREAFWRR